MKTFAAFLMLCSSAIAGGPCYTGNCYVKPYVAPVKYTPPVYNYNTTNTYHAPPVVLVGIPTPVAYTHPIAAQGYSVVGYTSVAQVFGPGVDSALLFDKSARAGAEARAFAQQATDNEMALASQRLQHQKELAETVAVGQVSREIIKAVGEATVARINAQAAASIGGGAAPGVFRAAAAPTTATGVLKARCVSCHAKYAEWDTLDFDTQFSIFSHVNSADPAKRMPRAADGKGEGEPLPDAEKLLLIPSRK